MSANTHLIDFQIPQIDINSGRRVHTLFSQLVTILDLIVTEEVKEVSRFQHGNSVIRIYTSDIGTGTLIIVRLFDVGMVTISIEYLCADKQTFKTTQEIEKIIRSNLKYAGKLQVLCPIKHGETRYLRSSDDRIIEYDIDKVLFNKRSPFQKIQIVHSKTLGKMLILDGLQNYSESDLIYTTTLMQKGKEKYQDKVIAILGGGSGALLFELLKENPRFVLMIEIDEMIMEACNKYMRSICGDVLEKRSGKNFKIVTGDFNQLLQNFVSDTLKFDYVFSDLPDLPLNTEDTETPYVDRVKQIFEMTFKILKPGGKLMTHCSGVNCESNLKDFESTLKKLEPPVSYKKDIAYVPSYYEFWVFYQVSKI